MPPKAVPKTKAAAKPAPNKASPLAAAGAAVLGTPAKADSKAKAPAAAAAKPPAKAAAGAKAAAPKATAAASKGQEEEDKKRQEAEEEQKKAEEEFLRQQEEKKKAEADAAAAAEEERKIKAEKGNGEVVLKYSMYNEKFPIKDGQMKATEIDEVYCLSDVMPGCKIHLSTKGVQDKYKIESDGGVCPFIWEEPAGTFHDLEKGEEYFVYVDEDETEFLKSQEKAKQNFAGVRSAATRGEGCSCIEGNPCGAECDSQGNAVCLDWNNRFAVAKANGWIGYQAK